jgi:sugar diacid utilization regulator
MYSLFVLSMMMFDNREEDDIVRLAMTSVASLSRCRAEAGYLVRNAVLARTPIGWQRPNDAMDRQVLALQGEDGPVSIADAGWHWAFALRRLSGHSGYLVVGADTTPSTDELFLLKVLAQQTSAALSNASHHRREREHALELRRLNEEKATVNARLTALVSDLERQRSIHDVLTKVSASGDGEAGIARALHGLTGLPVAAEDRFGNLRAWAGPGRPDPYPKADPRKREEVLRYAASHGGAIREKDRLFVLAQPRSDVIGVLVLMDPERTAGQHEVFALEHSAMALALELSHLHNLAEVELRLRRDLVDDLVTGTDEESAYLRSAAVGHDLHGTHHVIVAQWRTGRNEDALTQAFVRATARLEMSALVARRPGMVVALVRGKPQAEALHRGVAQEMGSRSGAVGVGGRCEAPTEFPRSFAEAVRALDIRKKSRSPDGVTSFDDLGVFRILHTGEGDAEIRMFVREWLGALLDYDVKRRTDLVPTLSQYLECGGNYDETAAVLLIHRSTLRYRLQRIREITGLDLADVDNRLNLHVATRAWKVLEGTP